MHRFLSRGPAGPWKWALFDVGMSAAARFSRNANRFFRGVRSWGTTCAIGAGIVVGGDTIKAKGPIGMRGRWGWVAAAGCAVGVANRFARERRWL